MSCPVCGETRFRTSDGAVQVRTLIFSSWNASTILISKHVESGACSGCRGQERARKNVYQFLNQQEVGFLRSWKSEFSPGCRWGAPYWTSRLLWNTMVRGVTSSLPSLGMITFFAGNIWKLWHCQFSIEISLVCYPCNPSNYNACCIQGTPAHPVARSLSRQAALCSMQWVTIKYLHNLHEQGWK